MKVFKKKGVVYDGSGALFSWGGDVEGFDLWFATKGGSWCKRFEVDRKTFEKVRAANDARWDIEWVVTKAGQKLKSLKETPSA